MLDNQRIRVLCVDDHPMILEGIAAIIGRQSDMELAGVAASGEQAIVRFAEVKPDITLMDLQLPGLSGLDAIGAIRQQCPLARVIVLTMFEGEEDIRNALNAGAVTYLLKGVRSADMLRAIRDVHAGKSPIPRSVALLLAGREGQAMLTEREIDVLRLIAEGHRNKEIGADLGITEETVKTHVRNILAKLEVSDRVAAVNVALGRGVIHLPR
jgi:DNA-binding NarL/FixJ family response regulator